MAKKRTPAKRKPKRAPKKPDLTMQLLKIAGGLSVLVLLVVGAGLLAYYFILQPLKESARQEPPIARLPLPPVKLPQKPTYEVFPEKDAAAKPLTRLNTLPGNQPPLVAIIIDDIGHDRQMAARFLAMKAPLTLSVLPFGPFSRQIISEARSNGHEIMLHLPMEPNEYPEVNPGPGALFASMSADQMIEQLNQDLEQLPGLKGVNNHMGSRLTTSPERMRQIFSILKKHNLYYIDSRTTAETVARPSANLLQVPFAERDIFIDHFADPAFIRSQLEKLIKRAQRQGFAVGIAHPHETTYQVLSQFLPRLEKEVVLVPASTVVQAVTLAENEKMQAKTQN